MTKIGAKLYDALKVKELKGSEVELTGEIPLEAIEHHRGHILAEMLRDFTLPGFRKGQVPMSLFLPHVNEISILEEATNIALNEAYPKIVKDKDIKVFGRPQVTITKLAPKNPVEFKIRVGVVPAVKLPDYKKIAKKIAEEETEISVSDEEITDVVKQVKKMRRTAKQSESREDKIDELELTDEFVKGLGNFKDVEDFKSKIKDNLKSEKESAAWKKKRDKILKNLIDNSKVELPQIVVEDEAHAISERFHKNLEERKMSKEEYLKKIGKTEEDVRREDIAHIESELKLRLILDKIATLENITVEKEEVDREMQYMQSRHPESDPENLRHYIENILRNEKLLRMLEGRIEEKTK